jgi:type II secretory pathway component GspD/PulD (secretin)
VLPRVFALTKVKYRIEPDVPPVPISLQLRPNDWAPVAAQVILEASKMEPTLTYSVDGDTLVVHIQKTPTGLPGSPVPEGTRRVKMTIENQPLRAVLAALFKDSTWKYEVNKDVQDVRISYTSTAEPELSALYAILKQASAKGKQVTYREGKGVLYIERGPLPGTEGLGEAVAAATVAPTQKTATLTVLDQRLKRVAAELATQTGSTITVAPNVPDLPVSVRIVNMPADQALGEIVKTLHPSLPNLTVRVAGPNTFVVELGPKK